MNTIPSNLNNRMARGLAACGIAFGLALSGVSASASQSASDQVCYFGECLAGAPAPKPSVPAVQNGEFRVLGKWTVLSNDKTVFVALKYDDGAMFAFAKNSEGRHLVFFDRNWNLKNGDRFVAKVDVDGRQFTIAGEALGDDTLVIANLSDDAMNILGGAQIVRVEVAGSKWSFTPADAVAVLNVALRSQ
jgi:hypothetical protein